MAWMSQALGGSKAKSDDPPFTEQDDPDWSDTSTESSDDVPNSDNHARPRDGNRVFLEQERALLPYMPALLNDDLPPCGLFPQVAYENVVRRLRKLWLQRAVQDAANVPLAEICSWILQDYKIEAEESPPGTLLYTGERIPWRHEDVFRYEIHWAKYFLREAEVMEKRVSMSKEELEEQDFNDGIRPIPKELGFSIHAMKRANRRVVVDLWKVWHAKKRRVVMPPPVHSANDVDGARDTDVKKGDEEDGQGHVKDEEAGDAGDAE